MMSPSHDGVQISSDALALALSGVALAVLLSTKVESWIDASASPAANPSSIEVSVQTEAAATPPPPAPPPPVQKPVPRRVVPQVRVAEIPVPAEPQLAASSRCRRALRWSHQPRRPHQSPIPVLTSKPNMRPAFEPISTAGLMRLIPRNTACVVPPARCVWASW